MTSEHSRVNISGVNIQTQRSGLLQPQAANNNEMPTSQECVIPECRRVTYKRPANLLIILQVIPKELETANTLSTTSMYLLPRFSFLNFAASPAPGGLWRLWINELVDPCHCVLWFCVFPCRLA